MNKTHYQVLRACEKTGLNGDQVRSLFGSLLAQEKDDALAVATAKIHNRFHTESVVIDELIDAEYHPHANGIVA